LVREVLLSLALARSALLCCAVAFHQHAVQAFGVWQVVRRLEQHQGVWRLVNRTTLATVFACIAWHWWRELLLSLRFACSALLCCAVAFHQHAVQAFGVWQVVRRLCRPLACGKWYDGWSNIKVCGVLLS
jgi:hypothetical protein